MRVSPLAAVSRSVQEGQRPLVKLTRFNHAEVVVNADMIEFVEQTPDTIITMVTGRKVLVKETADEVVKRVVAYRQQAGALMPRFDRAATGE